jgi:hypothetical protein
MRKIKGEGRKWGAHEARDSLSSECVRVKRNEKDEGRRKKVGCA